MKNDCEYWPYATSIYDYFQYHNGIDAPDCSLRRRSILRLLACSTHGRIAEERPYLMAYIATGLSQTQGRMCLVHNTPGLKIGGGKAAGLNSLHT